MSQTIPRPAQSLAAWFEITGFQKLNKSLTLQADFQYRRRSQWFDVEPRNGSPFHYPLQVVFRPWLHWQASPAFRVSISPLGYWRNFSVKPDGTHTITHELRNSFQALYEFKIHKSVLINRLRLECRYFSLPATTGQSGIKLGGQLFPMEPYAYRLRHIFRWVKPLSWSKKEIWYMALSDELLVNVGKNVRSKDRWDQNRAVVSLGCKISPKIKLESGYLNQYILRQSDPQINHSLFLMFIFENGSFPKIPDAAAGLD